MSVAVMLVYYFGGVEGYLSAYSQVYKLQETRDRGTQKAVRMI